MTNAWPLAHAGRFRQRLHRDPVWLDMPVGCSESFGAGEQPAAGFSPAPRARSASGVLPTNVICPATTTNAPGVRLVGGGGVKIAIAGGSAGAPAAVARFASQHMSRWRGVGRPRLTGGAPMFGMTLCPIVRIDAVYSAPALDFFAGSQVEPELHGAYDLRRAGHAVQRGSPTAVQPCPTLPTAGRFGRSVAAETGPTSARRTPTDSPTGPKLDPNMPKL
jgi:hypothetical protein